jgi:transcriptional regulator with XRE-family HTH domain
MQTVTQQEIVQIGRHLRYLRRMRDCTQEEMAKPLGVSVGWASRIEHEKHY